MAPWRSIVTNLISVILTLITIVNGQNEVPGQPVVPSQSQLGRAGTAECPIGIVGPTCVGCGTLVTCDGVSTVPQTSQPCSSINSNFISCKNAVCSADAPSDPTCATNSYSCTGVGQFPDPTDCTRYVICGAAGSSAVTFQCPPSYVYNSQTGLCRIWFCQNVDCSKSPNKYILYPPDSSVMIFCSVQGSVTKPYVYQCPDPKNMQYDLNTLQCSFICRSQGRFVDKTNCRRYYECYISGLTFQSRLQVCPTGYAYNGTNQVCVKQQSCVNEIDGTQVDTTAIQ